MVEGNAGEPQIVLIGTNVIIEGAINLANNVDNPEARIWSAFLQGRLKAAFSDVLLSEAIAVARRLMGKDFASRLRSQILDKANVLPKGELAPYIPQLSGKVPKEDIAHAALATAVNAKYIISNNREFLRSLKGKFKCVAPKSFVEMVRL
jgi:predicted nucleic acid-binding protein